jgi:hypothetical protein
MKKLLFLFIISIVFNQKVWDPYSLYDYIKKHYLESNNPNKSTNLQHMVVDPENYLKGADLSEINSMMKTLYEKYKINSYIILISHMDKYKNKNTDDEEYDINSAIEIFVSKFNYQMLRDNSFYEDNMTLTTIFFIKDRKMRMRTGRALRETIKDKDALNILNKRKNDLRKENYHKVVYDLINDVYFTYESNSEYYNSFFYKYKETILTTIFWVILIMVCIIRSMSIVPESEREKKIKEFLERNKTKKVKRIMTEACIICLENFMPEEEKLKIENFINKKKLKEEKTTFLECGHQFHEKCIIEWLKTQNKCPLCRINLKFDNGSYKNNRYNYINDDERRSFIDHDYLLNDVINDFVYIQRDAYPHQINEFQGNRIISDCNKDKNEKCPSDNDRDFDSFNDGSGGATSDW